VIIWSQLNHRNIVDFLGVVKSEEIGFALVAPWMSNETITKFLKRSETESVNRVNLVRLGLIHNWRHTLLKTSWTVVSNNFGFRIFA
jgi:hypothetical protein